MTREEFAEFVRTRVEEVRGTDGGAIGKAVDEIAAAFEDEKCAMDSPPEDRTPSSAPNI